MKKTMIRISIAFIMGMCLVVGSLFYFISKESNSEIISNELIALNEITQLTKDQNGISTAEEEIHQLADYIKENKTVSNNQMIAKVIVLLLIICIVYIVLIMMYLYFKIIRPFEKLEMYAGDIAKGNFEIELPYERTNFFGAFTWAFDHMRKEIVKSRNNEKLAIENNKVVIATLSHDIKTPVASIRAYIEALLTNMDTSLERKERYLEVIIRKCDEVTNFTNDLVLHSISDLEMLTMENTIVEIKELITKTINDFQYLDKIDTVSIAPATLLIDEKRMEQVLENLLNNAIKYAKSPIKLQGEIKENQYFIQIKDSGKGIPDEDMPFIFEKFYRGKNIGNQSGSGLGLYIVKYIINQMDGDIQLINQNDGLLVMINLPINLIITN